VSISNRRHTLDQIGARSLKTSTHIKPRETAVIVIYVPGSWAISVSLHYRYLTVKLIIIGRLLKAMSWWMSWWMPGDDKWRMPGVPWWRVMTSNDEWWRVMTSDGEWWRVMNTPEIWWTSLKCDECSLGVTLTTFKFKPHRTLNLLKIIGRVDATQLRFLSFCHCLGDAKTNQQMQLARGASTCCNMQVHV
jgi:hypothetical protein